MDRIEKLVFFFIFINYKCNFDFFFLNPVQLPSCLIRVFKDEVFALLQLLTDVDHAAQDAPGILHAQVNLAGKLVGLELLCAQDDMPR